MVHWKKNLIFVWLSQFLSLAGFSFAIPFIPFYMKHLGITDPAELNLWVAQFAAAGYLSFTIFSPIWGFLADIYGRRVMLLRANFITALLVPVMAYAPGVGWLVAIRFLMGAFSGTVTAAQTLVSGNTPYEKRGFALGTLSSALYSGSMAGAFLGGIIVDTFGYKIAFILCGCMFLAAGTLAVVGIKEDFEPHMSFSEKMKEFKVRLPRFGPVWYILLLVLIMGYARQFDMPFLPIMVEKVNGPVEAPSWTGLLTSASAIAGVLSGFILGWLADRISAPKVAIVSALMAGLMMIPHGLATSLGVLFAARFGMVFFAGGLDPVFQIWLAKCTPDKDRGLFFGWASSAKTLGWVLCSVSSGAVAMFAGVRAVYFVAAAVYLLLIPAICFAVKRLPSHK
ncbi:MAG: multidrug efflux MFS transporter [Lentisphaerae bacterium]|nr:multidrug efflux MFS transporter [Lentisphaerota bacterium]MCP4102842.1 multidrug efflux MFS transporter [Lentisphaerota bacterium]